MIKNVFNFRDTFLNFVSDDDVLFIFKSLNDANLFCKFFSLVISTKDEFQPTVWFSFYFQVEWYKSKKKEIRDPFRQRES